MPGEFAGKFTPAEPAALDLRLNCAEQFHWSVVSSEGGGLAPPSEADEHNDPKRNAEGKGLDEGAEWLASWGTGKSTSKRTTGRHAAAQFDSSNDVSS